MGEWGRQKTERSLLKHLITNSVVLVKYETITYYDENSSFNCILSLLFLSPRSSYLYRLVFFGLLAPAIRLDADRIVTNSSAAEGCIPTCRKKIKTFFEIVKRRKKTKGPSR
jgi:hypothetical protein